jgi:hypothetical protein
MKYAFYYTGEVKDGVLEPEYRPEPDIGQYWIDKDKNNDCDYKIIKIEGPEYIFKDKTVDNVRTKLFFYKDRFKELNFVGYFDTSNLIAKPTIDLNKYPHKCPTCSLPAYIGFNSIDCSNGCKVFK